MTAWIRYLIAIGCHYSGLDALYRRLSGAGLVVLMLHRLRGEDDPFPLSISSDTFGQIVAWLRDDRKLVSLDEGLSHLDRPRGTTTLYAVTLDDGYRDNLNLLSPPLDGVPATVYLATDHIGADPIWAYQLVTAVRCRRQDLLDLGHLGLGRFDLSDAHERRRALAILPPLLKQLPHERFQEVLDGVFAQLQPRTREASEREMMDWDDVRTLDRNGIDLGGHTRGHVLLSRVDAATAQAEIEGCTDQIAQVLHKRPRHFAYPNGTAEDFGPRDVELVRRAGYVSATTSIEGVNRTQTDRYRLLRFNVHESRYRTPSGALSPALFFSESSGLLGLMRKMASA
ncbi:polysaccharide deacetylase family protein [Lysobacter sp. SG-8]|uniref:Polysaccharide deacetylase family protein n=1 Tax=Marilutibacter penaei TaxID=2759900 RepID=A0A7W3U1T8_9GAMM|nr:polysaccharide deacetylase family protein [Lysobacter penaei]MBB1087411.1 polysaccharide deacetylase family protein [Lysobacter penaei]